MKTVLTELSSGKLPVFLSSGSCLCFLFFSFLFFLGFIAPWFSMSDIQKELQLGCFRYLFRLSPGHVFVEDIHIGREPRADQNIQDWIDRITYPIWSGNTAGSPKKIWIMCLGTGTIRYFTHPSCHDAQTWKGFGRLICEKTEKELAISNSKRINHIGL